MENVVDLRGQNEKEKLEEKIKRPKKLQQTETKESLEWSAPEFFYFEKTEIWFIISGLITLALFLSALWTRNILFALLIILGYLSIIAYAIKKPKNVVINVGPQGIRIDNTLYSYDNLKSFWIFYNPPELKEIGLLSKKTIMPHVKVPLGEQNPVEIKRVLIKYLPEKKQDESLIDNLARQLRF